MPIAPITGMLRKRFWLDVGCSLGLGVTGGYAYWYVLVPQPTKRMC
jgi:cytochrome c oxidase subunit 7